MKQKSNNIVLDYKACNTVTIDHTLLIAIEQTRCQNLSWCRRSAYGLQPPEMLTDMIAVNALDHRCLLQNTHTTKRDWTTLLTAHAHTDACTPRPIHTLCA